jgi:hypothetical protein
MNLNFLFKSSSHKRFENGILTAPAQPGVNRAIKVEPGKGDLMVTIYNLDGNHPVWQDNVQMAPKQMRVVQQQSDKVILRGYGLDAMGTPFSDYGLTIEFTDDQVSKCILHMHDRNIDIEYLPSIGSKNAEPEILNLSRRANSQFQNEDVTGARELLVKIYRSVKSNPKQLKNLNDYSALGSSFLLMLDQNLSDDIDTLQAISSVGYLCISKAIEADPDNVNLYKDRLLLLRIGHEPFIYTTISGLGLSGGSPFSAGSDNGSHNGKRCDIQNGNCRS